MKAFPMFIRTSGRRVIIVGGGEQAAQKARLMLKTDASLELVADRLTDELQALVLEGRATHAQDLSEAVFEEAAMAFIGTGCPALDVAAHALAKSARCPVNVVDQPHLCDLTTPAIVDRDPIVVAIGSEGTAPVLTRDIKTQLEQMLPNSIGGLAALTGRLRASVARSVTRAQRRALWAWVFKGTPRTAWTHGQERDAARLIKDAIARGGPPEGRAKGHISLVGAGPGARDLLTLRAVQRLQEADVIFYDRLVEEDVLELARRDAERVFVGKHVGAHAWPQEKINKMIVNEAQKGRRVVRLKSGDPGVFGRAGEELQAVRDMGLEVELVPGVTAALAAGAALGQSLTERSVSDALILATASGSAADPLPDAVRSASPGSTLVVYMGVSQAARLSAGLEEKGLSGTAPVDVVVDATKPTQRVIHSTVATLNSDIATHLVTGCAVIIARWPKHAAQTRARYSRLSLTA